MAVVLFAALVFVLAFLSSPAKSATAAAGGGVSFSVTNDAAATSGGKRFDQVVSSAYARQVLQDASTNAWRLLRQGSTSERRPLHSVALAVVEQLPGDAAISSTRNGDIYLSAATLMTKNHANLRNEVTGQLYQEVARVWANDGEGTANPRLLEGIAELARLRAGHAPGSWAKAGEGSRWDQARSGVAGRFFDYLDGHYSGLVAKLNSALRGPASDGDDILKHITGKTIQELWVEYKAAFAA
ncbi:hypothetical protein ACP4OV_008569 [Aristida adscensionis]